MTIGFHFVDEIMETKHIITKVSAFLIARSIFNYRTNQSGKGERIDSQEDLSKTGEKKTSQVMHRATGAYNGR